MQDSQVIKLALTWCPCDLCIVYTLLSKLLYNLHDRQHIQTNIAFINLTLAHANNRLMAGSRIMGAVNNDGFLEVTVSSFKEIITTNGLSGEFEEMP